MRFNLEVSAQMSILIAPNDPSKVGRLQRMSAAITIHRVSITSCIQDEFCCKLSGCFRSCCTQDKTMPNHRNKKGKSNGTTFTILNYLNPEKRTIQKEIEAAVNFALKLTAISLAMQARDSSISGCDRVRDSLIETVSSDPTIFPDFFMPFNVWFVFPPRSLPTPHGRHQPLFQNFKSAISKDSATRHPPPGRLS
jgi:hypothetical protein